jgi:NADH:ubiquinone oxidoreductase subunit 3 (subunit A)
MLFVALVLILLGVIGLFLFPWAGIPAGIVGLVLLIAFLFGFGRRAGTAEPHQF